MNFIFYDLIFLVVFTLVVSFLLYKNKKNVKREMGIAFLYRAQWGVKLIEYVGKKYTKTLNFLKWVIIPLCYLLMAGIIWLIGRSVYSYVTQPLLTQLIKAPPLAPVIPYFPQLFGMKSFFPDFYFTYFIVALGIVAIVHEFSHGIFMRHNNVRIKSTGLAFFGPFMGAFVEQNDKDLNKLKKTDQMAILGAGVFANVVFGIIFFFIWMGLFSGAFVANGVMISPTDNITDGYSKANLNISAIDKIESVNISNLSYNQTLELLNNNEIKPTLELKQESDLLFFFKLFVGNEIYYVEKNILESNLKNNREYVIVYYDLPAINSGLRGNIIQVGDEKIKDMNEFLDVYSDYELGDKILIKTSYKNEILEYDMILEKDPYNSTRGILGINGGGFTTNIEDQLALVTNALFSKLGERLSFITNALFSKSFKIEVMKTLGTNYEIKNEFLVFLYHMAFWVFIINILVALFNMLPGSILDGGRFFYLTVLGLTESGEKGANFIYRIMGYLIIFAFALMMFIWFVRLYKLIGFLILLVFAVIMIIRYIKKR